MNIEEWEEYQHINDAMNDMINSMDDSSQMKSVVGHICRSGGKRVRPIILMLASRICGGNYEKSVNAALAIELIHSASLIHDDILDEGVIRRGVESAHKKYGPAAAMLAGDYMISKSIELISSYTAPVVREFGRAGMAMAEGETIDIKSTNGTFEDSNYFDCINKKTASLFAASAAMGAYIADADEATAEMLKDYGEKLGIAYQIIDDLLEYTETSGDKRSDHESVSILQIYQKDMSQQESIQKATDVAIEYVDMAKDILAKFGPSDAKDKLLKVTDYITIEMIPEY
ncbi:polyprenyl synthetase family protein [Methanococcoides methylutens]|uniref:Geranylfarnesyl diphosphate synthetase n=1 Tax=Methanococcoides methylutens MM1 TaxID=1434104 RepID=A0A0E3X124_METMT|nr:polyprenyl synthetase family protein [Methanococcoides methylutens]AKB85740.1 Geranylfarnesyl diphosphate synthetase [Methanococcoides methylutens MM1]